MTAIFAIDTAAMHHVAQRIRQATGNAGFDSSDHASLQPAISALAVPCLRHAVGAFLERWGTTLTDLVDDAHRLADAIDLAAGSYQDAESLIEGGVRG